MLNVSIDNFNGLSISDHTSYVAESLDAQTDKGYSSGSLDHSSDDSNNCIFCGVSFKNESLLNDHCTTPEHELNYYQVVYSDSRALLIQDKGNLKITTTIDPGDPSFEEKVPEFIDEDTNGKIIIQLKEGAPSVTAPIYIRNLGEKKTDLLCAVKLYDCNRIEISDEHGCIEKDTIIRIAPESIYKIFFTAIGGNKCVQELPVIFRFQESQEEEDDNVFEVLRVLVIEVVEELTPKEDELTIEEREAILKYMAVPPSEGTFTMGIHPNIPNHRRGFYEEYYPSELRQLAELFFRPKHIDDRELRDSCMDYWRLMNSGLSSHNYKRWFKVQLWLEEIRKEDDYKNFHQIDGNSKYTVVYESLDTEEKLIELYVPGLSEKRPGLLKTDSVYFRRHGEPEPIYEGVIHRIRGEYVHLAFDQDYFLELQTGFPVDVQFAPNRHNFIRCHNALNKCEPVLHKLFPSAHLAGLNELTHETLVFFDDKIANNAEQKQAVKMMVNGTSAPYPYILFGPPGTGKTLTIVEAIKQIHKLNQHPRILVCGPSNSACDILAERLLVNIDRKDILRVNAISRNADHLSARVKAVSLIEADQMEFPSLKNVSTYKIVVCTYMTAYKLVPKLSNSRIEMDYTHVFLDECGHGMEPESLIPLLSLSDNVVLAGDPKQLGPVVSSPFCKTEGRFFRGAGLDQSLLERLMGIEPYKAIKDEYYVTKLLNNFRSHEKILEVPNKLFYDSELRAKANKLLVNSMLQFSELPNKKIPIIFKGVEGRDTKTKNNPSFFNVQEVTEVVKMLKVIRKEVSLEDIGIIAPYKTQIKKIKNALKNSGEYSDLDLKEKLVIGSPEQFQGDERKVIIVSTVRASGEFLFYDINKQLGFLRNPKRFNVIITRAIAMLVIVGCPWILQMDNNWGTLLNFCIENGCYDGPDVAPLALKGNEVKESFHKLDWISNFDNDFPPL